MMDYLDALFRTILLSARRGSIEIALLVPASAIVGAVASVAYNQVAVVGGWPLVGPIPMAAGVYLVWQTLRLIKEKI